MAKVKTLTYSLVSNKLFLALIVGGFLAATVAGASLVERVKDIYAGVGTSPSVIYSASAAATDIFMEMDGVEGESQDKSHKGEIDVMSWSWGMSHSGTGGAGGGGGAGKVNVQDLNFTKKVDKSTPDLMMHVATGKHIKEVKMTVRKAGKEGKPQEYLIITMKDVLVTSYGVSGGSSDDRPVENVTLNFAEVKVEYQEYDDKGNPVGGPKTFEWNVEEGRES